MIDDVTLVVRLKPSTSARMRSFVGGEPVLTTYRRDPLTVRDFEWKVARGRAFVLKHCEETNEVELRVSVPRLSYSPDAEHTYNFPLAPYPSVKGIPLRGVSDAVLEMLGLSLPDGGDIGIRRWGVRRIAYAVDLVVPDVSATIDAIGKLRRRGERKAWGQPPHAVQWDTDEYRTMFYSKRAEVLKRIKPLRKRHDPYHRVSTEFRQAIAEQARDMVRFEVTLLGAKGVRSPLGMPGGLLPTFEYMARPEVSAYILGRELGRLGLGSVGPDWSTPQGEGTVRDAALTFRQALRGSGKRTSNPLVLLAVLQLSGSLSDEEFHDWLGVAPSTLRKHRASLRALGLVPTGQACLGGRHHLAAFLDAFHEIYPDVPASLPELHDDDYVAATWADRLPDDDGGFDGEGGQETE